LSSGASFYGGFMRVSSRRSTGRVSACGSQGRRPRWRFVERRIHRTALLLASLTFAVPSSAKAEPNTEEQSPAVRVSPLAAAVVWGLVQLIPSPLYVATSDRVGGGVRWQITPLIYSFGVAARPVRTFIIEPVARHTGAIELFASPEWACCAVGDATSFIARGGARLYFPLIGRGEALTGSLGGSYYRAGDGTGGSAEVGVYALFASLGLTVTVSPRLTGREVITALHIRYF
jgi:hypothetical protein